MQLKDALPEDLEQACLIGRMLTQAGPSPVMVRGGRVFDLSAVRPTVSALLSAPDLPQAAGRELGRLTDLDLPPAGPGREGLLSPIDLQCVKAAGVTFAASTLERVIEERARGNAALASSIRQALSKRIGSEIRSIVPGSTEAERLKQALIEDGLWSQYLEVAIGPYAEIFTKAPVLSTVGWGAEIGVRSDSTWNNPEPEIVLVCDPSGKPVGASLGNDVNLRDIEGRSALLLGKAKDNNASCAIGPFIRLFDDTFTMDDVRSAVVRLKVTGEDGFVMEGENRMSEISRDPEDLAGQVVSEHQYPDGFALFLGTLFAPTQDRDQPGAGFTHKTGDVVEITSPRLGTLTNTVTTSRDAAPWAFGIGALMQNLAARGLLQ